MPGGDAACAPLPPGTAAGEGATTATPPLHLLHLLRAPRSALPSERFDLCSPGENTYLLTRDTPPDGSFVQRLTRKMAMA